MFLEICMQIYFVVFVDKLTSKKYVKTIKLLCAGNKVFVKYQAQGGVLTPTPCIRPGTGQTFHLFGDHLSCAQRRI